MKRSSSQGFTLIEMLTVMAVIAILTGMVIAINGYTQKKAALLKAGVQVKSLATAAENYKADFGAYPRDTLRTDVLDPRTNGAPASSAYLAANLYFYKMLSGDAGPGITPPTVPAPDAKPDGKPETKSYFDFPPNMLKKTSLGEIQCIVDPFGNAFGYSTAGAAEEEKFRGRLQSDPSASRTTTVGFNPFFDLWSTGGVSSASTSTLGADQLRWVKNW